MTDDQLHAWQLFHVTGERLRRELGREMWAEAQLSDAEFTVLANVSLAEGRGAQVRPAECARAIGWESSRLAHQLRRLEQRGFIQRGPGAGDGRASVITLTDAGRGAYKAALGPHLRSTKRWFADALSGEQTAALTDALEALMAHIDSRTGAPVLGDAS